MWPRRTIDYILGYMAKGNVYETHGAEVIDERVASDHRPLFVDIRLNSPGTPASETVNAAGEKLPEKKL